MSHNFPAPRISAPCMLVIVGFISGGSVLEADVIYSNFGTGDAYSAGSGVIVTNDGSAGSSVAIAFTPTANYDLSSIEFVATDLTPDASDSITIGIFADNGGQPGGPALESFTEGPLGQFGNVVPVMTVTSVIQPLLEANTQYWVGMNAPAGDLIIWNQNSSGATGFSETDGSGNWSTSDPFQGQGAVEIDGTLASVILGSPTFQTQDSMIPTPEPAAWWLTTGGLAVVACFRRGRAARGKLSVCASVG